MQFLYICLANVVVGIHVGYVAFVVFGLVAIVLGAMFQWSWVRNPWFRLVHLVAILVVAAETVIGMRCPLTTLENQLRDWGGQATLDGDFIGRLLHESIFFFHLPDSHWLFKVMYFGFAGLVVMVFVLVRPRWPRQNRAA